MSNVISWVPQLLPFSAGHVGIQRLVDVASGASETRAFRLNAFGAPVQTLIADQVGPALAERLANMGIAAPASYVHPLLAATASAPMRSHYGAVKSRIAQLTPRGLHSLTLPGAQLAVLEGQDLAPDGRAQSLHLIDLTETASSYPVDLSGLVLTAQRAITAMAALGEALVVAVSDPLAGFDLYALTDLSGDPVFAPILDGGAHRHALNSVVPCVSRDGDGLLFGTAALAEGATPVGNWGPELLRLDAQGLWDLVIGQPRFSPDGLRFPASGREPGLQMPGVGIGNAALRAVAKGQMRGRPLTVIALQDRLGPAAPDRRRLTPSLVDYIGSARLYATIDGADWAQVPLVLPAGAGAVTALSVGPGGILVGHEGLGAEDLPVTVVPMP